MIFYELMRWWYGAGWLQAWRNVLTWPRSIGYMFSIPILIKTLFAPWHRITTPAGPSLDSKFHASIDNLVSRFIGMLVRFLVLLTSAILALLVLLVGILMAAAWVFIPAGVLVLIVLGISA